MQVDFVIDFFFFSTGHHWQSCLGLLSVPFSNNSIIVQMLHASESLWCMGKVELVPFSKTWKTFNSMTICRVSPEIHCYIVVSVDLWQPLCPIMSSLLWLIWEVSKIDLRVSTKFTQVNWSVPFFNCMQLYAKILLNWRKSCRRFKTKT